MIALAGCGRPTPVPVLAGHADASACDEAAWQQLASTSLRARVGDLDVRVVDEHAGRSRIVVRPFGVILVGDVSDRRLVRVVTRETPVWEGPGGPPLPGLVAEPGMTVGGSGSWLEVHERYPIEVNGYVPAAATGHVWDAQPPLDQNGRKLGFHGDVLAEPVASGQHLAGIAAQDPVVDTIEPGPAGWLKVTAHDAQLRVAGWVAIPQQTRPSAMVHTYDFSDDTIEGDLVRPDSVTQHERLLPGCLRASPDRRAPVVGLATQSITGTRVSDEWLHVVLDTPWGKVDAYGVIAPPEPQGSAAWWPTDDYGRAR